MLPRSLILVVETHLLDGLVNSSVDSVGVQQGCLAVLELQFPFFALVPLVHDVLHFLAQFCFDLCGLDHVQVVAIRRHFVEGLLELLVEDHIKQPDRVEVPVPLPLGVLRDLAQFARLETM